MDVAKTDIDPPQHLASPMTSEQDGPENVNPYAASSIEATSEVVSMDNPEAVRRAYLTHEASVKSIGTLFILGSVLVVIGSTVSIASALAVQMPDAFEVLLGMSFVLLFGIASGVTGFALQRLHSWSRWGGTAFSAFGLLNIPIGTVISAYFLYLLLSKKGAMVFSEEYKHVIAQTPHIKHKTSMVVWFLIILFLLFMAFAVGVTLFVGV